MFLIKNKEDMYYGSKSHWVRDKVYAHKFKTLEEAKKELMWIGTPGLNLMVVVDTETFDPEMIED